MSDIDLGATEIPEDMTELFDAYVPRSDLVGAAANGIPRPLIAKQAEGSGLLDPAYVRSLIEKSDPPAAEDMVTMTGSPAAIAALIHNAPVRKAEMKTADINDLPDSDFAYVESGAHKDDSGKTVPRSLRHFPINDEAHVRDALSRAPQSPFGDKAMPKIRAAAKKFKIDVEKAAAMEMDDTDGMDPTVVLCEPEDEMPGDEGDPGSPAWEAIDAATARKWTSILARARTALGVMADREALEAATGDESDIDNAMDLSDAACAIDYAISVLAPFAVDEQAEADCGADEMEMLGKALAAFDTTALETLEGFAPLRKAGRALSSANEAAIRAALTSLETILASLPKAPDAEPAAPATVQKETDPAMSDNDDVKAALDSSTMLGTPKEPAAAETPAAIGMPGEVAKAGKPPQVAIYDANGNLVGTVDPAEITMLAPAKAPAAAVDEDGTDGAMAAADSATPAEAAAPPTDMAPAPAAEVGTPADATTADDDGNVAKATDTTETDALLKSSVTELVKAAIDDYSAGQADVVKGLEDRNRTLETQVAELAKQAALAATLEQRLAAVENAPAVMAIASNGAIPPAHLLRGQDRGNAPVALTKAQEMRNAFKASDDATKQQVLAQGLNALAIDELSRIHAAGPS